MISQDKIPSAEIQRDGWKAVGKVRDAHGLKGELFIVSFSHQVDWIEGLTDLCLERKEKNKEGELVPVWRTYPVKRKKPHKVGLIVKLDGIEDRTQAESFKGARALIPSDLLTSEVGENIYLSEIQNFVVSDQAHGVLGSIEAFGSNGAQDLLVIENALGKRWEVPFVPEFLASIDWKNREIKMNLPEGLID